MTEQEKIEGNKLIAEFMGGFVRDMGKGDLIWDHSHFTSPLICKGMYELEYHSNWGWLMPVVEKIESLGFDSRICGNNSDGGFLCDFVDAENNETSCKTSYTSKIEAVYLAVVDFIKWENESNGQSQP